MKQKFFEISANSTGNAFAYAPGYGPFSDAMPFLTAAQHAEHLAFWEIAPSPPGLEIEGGRLWPDFLMCGMSPPMFFVSGKILATLANEGIEIRAATPVPIATVKSRTLKAATAPNYHVLQVPAGIEVDFQASGIPVDANGMPKLTPLPRPWPPRIQVRHDSWSGADLCSWSNWGPDTGLSLLCTQRVVDLAKVHRWSNVDFDRIG